MPARPPISFCDKQLGKLFAIGALVPCDLRARWLQTVAMHCNGNANVTDNELNAALLSTINNQTEPDYGATHRALLYA
jgi:hypothetical protein